MTFVDLYDTNLDIELGSGQTQLFTVALRKSAVNAAMRDFVRKTGCTKKYDEIPLVDETQEYDVYDTLTDYIRLAGAPSVKWTDADSNIRYIQGAKDFPRRSKEELDRLEPGWRDADPGTPSAWYLTDDTGELVVGLYPAPEVGAGETWVLIVPYVANPTTMVGDATEPFTVGGTVMDRLEPYHQALVHFAAAQLEPLRKNYTGVQYQMQLYTGYVAEYLRQDRQDGQDQITLLRDYYAEGQRSARAKDHTRYP